MPRSLFGYFPEYTDVKLEGIQDVDTTAPSEDDVLTWKASTEKWTAEQIPNTDPKGNYSATTDPTVNDDTGAGYGVGSAWVNTTTDTAFVCLDASSGAAVWDQISLVAKYNTSATVAPTVNDDSGSGYSPGSLWVDVTADRAYICLDASAGAAVWSRVDPVIQNNYSATSAPTPSDDSSGGYTPGSIWVDVTDDAAYLCVDASVSSAIWRDMASRATNYAAVADPTVNDDSGSGYTVGSPWVNTSTGILFLCTDASVGAAVWKELNLSKEGFRAQITSARTIGNNSLITLNNWNSPSYNVGSASFSTSTGIFTAQEPGTYLIGVNVLMGNSLFSPAVNTGFTSTVSTSSGSYTTYYTAEATTTINNVTIPPANGAMRLNAGDTVRCQVSNNTGASVNISTRTYIRAYRISS